MLPMQTLLFWLGMEYRMEPNSGYSMAKLEGCQEVSYAFCNRKMLWMIMKHVGRNLWNVVRFLRLNPEALVNSMRLNNFSGLYYHLPITT